MSYLESNDQADDHEAYQEAVRRLRFYCEGDGKEIVDWWMNQAGSIKRFDPDFTLVRLRPFMAWERNRPTWDDIMTEIGDEALKEEIPPEHTMTLLKTATLALANQAMIEKLLKNQQQILQMFDGFRGLPDDKDGV